MSGSMWDMEGTSLTTLYTKPHGWQDRVQWPFFLPAPQFLGEESVSFMSISRFLVWSDEQLHVGHGRNKHNYPLHQTPLMAGSSTMTPLPSCTTISQWRQCLSHVPFQLSCLIRWAAPMWDMTGTSLTTSGPIPLMAGQEYNDPSSSFLLNRNTKTPACVCKWLENNNSTT